MCSFSVQDVVTTNWFCALLPAAAVCGSPNVIAVDPAASVAIFPHIESNYKFQIAGLVDLHNSKASGSSNGTAVWRCVVKQQHVAVRMKKVRNGSATR